MSSDPVKLNGLRNKQAAVRPQ